MSGLKWLVIAWVFCTGACMNSNGALAATETPADSGETDPYLWLEDVEGSKPLAWVEARNAECRAALTEDAEFDRLRGRVLDILESKERIPYPDKKGNYLYNFWKDDVHVRGLLRRTSLESYRTTAPAWETVLDLDRLSQDENENWVWMGYDMLYPEYDRCLIYLSRGGGDTKVMREFDLVRKEFIPDGFTLPAAKISAGWCGRDTLYVATDFGPGSLNTSGYPRIVKAWARGTPLDMARTIYEGSVDEVWAFASREHDRGHTYDFLYRGITFFTSEVRILRNGDWIKIDKPDDADVSTFGDQVLLRLRSDWKPADRTFPAGSLLAAPLDAFLGGSREFQLLFEPTERRSLAGYGGTLHHVILNELDNVQNRLYVLSLQGGVWKREPMQTPGLATVAVWGVDPDHSDDYWMDANDFLTPSTLSLGTIGDGQGPAVRVRALPAYFDTTGLEIAQRVAISADGTSVPYWLVSREGIERNGANPTLLSGYGGFEVSLQSAYSPTIGAAWLEHGGVYAIANIRGGGEFGPAWHTAALKENRQRAYDDFIAVAEDLIRSQVTSPARLGIMGGSNGGLLMGNMLVQRPDLFGAIVCQVPLLDMKRYTKLSAGASWIAEYGDPEKPEEWAFLRKYSPYENVSGNQTYPPILFLTSTRDDRVHPGHARKMVAKMREQGHRNVLLYENTEGGHAAAANNAQRAYMDALQHRFLQKTLGLN